MPEPEATATPKLDQETIEAGILDRLTDHHDQRPWSEDELIRDINDRITTIDALKSLRGHGLIHRCGDLIYPTRAALHAERLQM